MNNNIFKQFEININDLKPKILDSIVKVYGEKNKSIIEQRLDTIYINSYITYEDISNYYNSLLNHKKNLLSIAFLNDIGIEVSPEIQDKVYVSGDYHFSEEQKTILQTYFEYSNFSEYAPIYSFDDIDFSSLNEYTKEKTIKERCKILKSFDLEIEPENYDEIILTDDGKNALASAKKVYAIATSYRNEFRDFTNSNSELKEYINSCDSYKRDLEIKYMKQFFTDLMPYLDESEQKSILNALNSETHDTYDFQRLADPDKKYYLYSPNEVNPNIDESLSSKIIALRMNNEIQKDREFFLATGNYADCLNNLSALELQSEADFSIDFVKQKVTCVSPSLVKDSDGNIQNLNILHLPILGMMQDSRDVLIMHEILHVAELSMKNISDDNYKIKCGLDSLDLSTSSTKPENAIEDDFVHVIRPYELLSENIHHNIAIFVTETMHDNGTYLFDDPKCSKLRGSSSYEELNSLTVPFLNEFHSEIIDAMVSPDVTSFMNIVGEDNISALNANIVEYRNMPYYKMMNDVINNVDSDLTQKRNDLISSSRKIVSEMVKHKENQKDSYSISISDIGKSTINTPRLSKVNAKKAIEFSMSNLLEGEHEINE